MVVIICDHRLLTAIVVAAFSGQFDQPPMIGISSVVTSPIRRDIAALEHSGITRIAKNSLHDAEVTPLWFGESDIVTPEIVRDAAKSALDRGETFYSSSRGTPEFRRAIADYHKRHYKIDLHDDRIIIPGSTMLGVLLAGQCLLGNGDEIILIGPYWPNIRQVTLMQGAVPIDVRLDEGPDGWSLDMEKVAASITLRTKAIYVNTPSNPTGWIMSVDEQTALLALMRQHGLGLISDEVYHRNVFTGRNPAPSFLELIDDDEPVFVLNGCSKAWAMTGWRVGWLIGPKHLAEPLAVLSECNNTGATVFAQAGACVALAECEDFVDTFNKRCRANRDVVMNLLAAHPRVSMSEPQGAFYAFPKIEGIDEDSLSFAEGVLAHRKIGIAAGYTFGIGNESHVRICFAIGTERFTDAMERLVDYLG